MSKMKYARAIMGATANYRMWVDTAKTSSVVFFFKCMVKIIKSELYRNHFYEHKTEIKFVHIIALHLPPIALSRCTKKNFSLLSVHLRAFSLSLYKTLDFSHIFLAPYDFFLHPNILFIYNSWTFLMKCFGMVFPSLSHSWSHHAEIPLNKRGWMAR